MASLHRAPGGAVQLDSGPGIWGGRPHCHLVGTRPQRVRPCSTTASSMSDLLRAKVTLDSVNHVVWSFHVGYRLLVLLCPGRRPWG